MSDPDRIEALVVVLRQLWLKYPDLRFGQLVGFMAAETAMLDTDPFYIEDAQWLRMMLEILNERD